MSEFSLDWLSLREPADKQARDAGLLQRTATWLASRSCDRLQIVDLGCGSGSTMRTLNPALESAVDANTETKIHIDWHLVDHDARLLSHVERQHGQEFNVRTYQRDLADLDQLPLAGAQLVTASALFDLVSAEFVDALAGRIAALNAQQPTAFYAALNYDGVTQWNPQHPLDEAVLAAFNRDQRRDKGFGPALGPESGAKLGETFTRMGYTVSIESSPWRLGADHKTMLQELIKGIASAVANDQAIKPEDLEDWRNFRMSHVADGHCIVGHSDVLALPSSS